MVARRQDAVKAPTSGEILTALIIPVIQLEAHFTRAGDAIAASGGQTLARWLSLDAVAGGPETVANIARKLGLTRQSVQRIADLLEADGLTEYRDNPEHQRSKLVVITARGRRALAAIRASQRVWAEQVGADVGESDLRQLSRIVERLTRALVSRAR